MDPKTQKSTKKVSTEKVKKPKKKRKHGKHSGKSDVKGSGTSPDADQGLEVEGFNVLEDSQNDSSHTPSPSLKQNVVQLLSSSVDYALQSTNGVQVLNNIKKSIRLVPINELTHKKIARTRSEPNHSAVYDIVNSVNSLSLKSKANSSRTAKIKGQNSSKAVSRSKKVEVKAFYSQNGLGISRNVTSKMNESVRWDCVLDDSDAERERIQQYKINRRKRYLEVANSKGLGWVLNYSKNGSPLSDSGIEYVPESVIPKFSSVRTLSLSHPVLSEVGIA